VIIDGHVHISATEYGNVNVLLRQLDEVGIERAVCVPGGMIDVRQFSRIFSGKYQPDPNIPNHLVFAAIEEHADRFYGFVCVNPKEGAGAVEMLIEGLDRGCRGVKLAPMVHRFRFDDPMLDEIAAECGSRGFPVYTHVLPNPGTTTADYAALARRVPQTNFIIGHMGFGPADADAIELARDMDNFYLETSLGNTLVIGDALAAAGAKKLIFGSEFPLSHPRVELEKIKLLDASSHEAILGGNICRLLKIQPK
jgi:hypothetical protein